MFLLLALKYFTPFSSASVVDFEQVNVSWVCELIQSEAVAQTCSVKKMFIKILQNSEENTCVRVSFLIKLQPSENTTFFYSTPPVAASVLTYEDYLNTTKMSLIKRSGLTNFKYTLFLISNTFISKIRLKLAKNQQPKQHPEVELLLFSKLSIFFIYVIIQK